MGKERIEPQIIVFVTQGLVWGCGCWGLQAEASLRRRPSLLAVSVVGVLRFKVERRGEKASDRAMSLMVAIRAGSGEACALIAI